jgi:hypothetical protein
VARIRSEIKAGFPGLAATFQVTSEETRDYNCIGWAAGDTSRWWWPLYPSYWPSEAAHEATLEAFVAAFATLGYAPCADGNLEEGVEKVVIYLRQGVPTHMARQLASGAWTSKLGDAWDIGHLLPTEVGGRIYGDAVQYLSRQQI